jgi:3-methyl-2-oxobutanoate hydroxymethyltransferase
MRTSFDFLSMKREGRPIAMLTAYDAPTAKAEAESGVDIILVGDSVGTNVLGYKSEREVTLADICHHTAAVRRGAPETFVLSDLPYLTYETPEEAVANARKLVASGANMVKFEGARENVVIALRQEGIEVCCHLGLEPQHHEELRLKGRSAADALKLVEDALRLEAAGAQMLVLELIPEEVGDRVTRAVRIPTIGIGAGRYTDGQVLVITDLLGIGQGSFRHNKRYGEHGAGMAAAALAYVSEVRERKFPGEANAFHMAKDELEMFRVKQF